jgi:hypothetical protein
MAQNSFHSQFQVMVFNDERMELVSLNHAAFEHGWRLRLLGKDCS